MTRPPTLLSFAALQCPPALLIPPGTRYKRSDIIRPFRWCPVHLEALRVVVQAAVGVPVPCIYATDVVQGVHCDLDTFQRLLRDLEAPEEAHEGLYMVAKQLASILTRKPGIYLGPHPIGYGNSHVLHSFVWLVNATLGPRQLVAHTAHNYSRELRFRQHAAWISPDLCISRDPSYGALPCFIPVFYDRCCRVPLAREIAFILAYAQQWFRGLDEYLSTALTTCSSYYSSPPPPPLPDSVEVVVLRFGVNRTFFVSAEVSRSYLESTENDGVPDQELLVRTSEEWDLTTAEGRWGLFVALKENAWKVFLLGGEGAGAKRKLVDISV